MNGAIHRMGYDAKEEQEHCAIGLYRVSDCNI